MQGMMTRPWLEDSKAGRLHRCLGVISIVNFQLTTFQLTLDTQEVSMWASLQHDVKNW